jgi:hypothetical protein
VKSEIEKGRLLLHILQQFLCSHSSTQDYARSATDTPLILLKENQRLPGYFNNVKKSLWTFDSVPKGRHRVEMTDNG